MDTNTRTDDGTSGNNSSDEIEIDMAINMRGCGWGNSVFRVFTMLCYDSSQRETTHNAGCKRIHVVDCYILVVHRYYQVVLIIIAQTCKHTGAKRLG